MGNVGETILRETIELGEYEADALDGLLRVGRTTAPNLAEITGIPNARIYGILDNLGNAGYVKINPGRPKEYEPKGPASILEQAEENRRQAYEKFKVDIGNIRSEFLDYYEPLYEQADSEIGSTEDLFYVVDVGEPSERKTRQVYQQATSELQVMTKSFEYIDSVTPALRDAIERDVSVKILFTHPKHLAETNAEIQQDILELIDTTFDAIEYRFSTSALPWRGTIADPHLDSGTAIFLVGEKNTPLHMRQAAITEDESFVAGMNRYFDLMWTHESDAKPT